MNPEKMRETYGKLIYLLQDANTADMVEELGFSLHAPIRTVHSKLKEVGALGMLSGISAVLCVGASVNKRFPQLPQLISKLFEQVSKKSIK